MDKKQSRKKLKFDTGVVDRLLEYVANMPDIKPQRNINLNRIYSVEGAADVLWVSSRTVRRYIIGKGVPVKLRSEKVTNGYVILGGWLNDFVLAKEAWERDGTHHTTADN